MNLTARKREEAIRRLTSFDAEFKRWCKESQQGGALQRHGSQIRAVEQMLAELRAGICRLLPNPNQPDALDASIETSRLALALFGIWDFFRAKLDQRRNSVYTDALRMGDELAWVCYQPTRNRGVKEPPLVFFNSGTSPFILRRDMRFYAEGLPRELLSTESITAATARLPFPVIGVPWSQIDHLPDAVVIGHEVGHAVEADLGLTADIAMAIDAGLAGREGGESRKAAWKKWLSEVFADLYGCLATGPAFTLALRDFLAAPAAELRAEQPSESSAYPPASVRVRFNTAVLESMNLEEGPNLWLEWQREYEPMSEVLELFLADAVAVAAKLLSTPFTQLSNQPITSLLTFTSSQVTLAEDLAVKAAGQVSLPNTSDLRALFAAVRVAYENDPEGYDRRPEPDVKSTLERLKERIAANVKDVYRAGEKIVSSSEQKVRDQMHRDRGSHLLGVLRATATNQAL